MTGYTLAQKAKAVAAFVGAIVTGVAGLSVVQDWEVGGVNVAYALGIVAAVLTYVATFKIPNAPGDAVPAGEIEGTH